MCHAVGQIAATTNRWIKVNRVNKAYKAFDLYAHDRRFTPTSQLGRQIFCQAERIGDPSYICSRVQVPCQMLTTTVRVHFRVKLR